MDGSVPTIHQSIIHPIQSSNAMKKKSSLLLAGLATISIASAADPRVDSWFTKDSAKYARLYATTADLNSGNAVTTWSRGSISQTLPAYCGVQELYSSSDWVYLRTTGLGSHIMGPWYVNS